MMKCECYEVKRNEVFSHIVKLCPQFSKLGKTDKFNFIMNCSDDILKSCMNLLRYIFCIRANREGLNPIFITYNNVH